MIRRFDKLTDLDDLKPKILEPDEGPPLLQ